jgi:hypothetical protein
VRHWFNALHAAGHTGAKPDWRLWPAAAVPVLWRDRPRHSGTALGFDRRCRRGSGNLCRGEADRRTARCHVCHSAKPKFPGFAEAFRGVMSDTPAQIKRLAPQIMARAVNTHTIAVGERDRDHRSRTVDAGVVDRGGIKTELDHNRCMTNVHQMATYPFIVHFHDETLVLPRAVGLSVDRSCVAARLGCVEAGRARTVVLVRRQGEFAHPRALDLQDPGLW